jgi:hypothetical protein
METEYKGIVYKEGQEVPCDFDSNVFHYHKMGKIVLGLYEDEYGVYARNHIGWHVVSAEGNFWATLPDYIDGFK